MTDLETVKELLMRHMDDAYENGSQLDDTGERMLLALLSISEALDDDLVSLALSLHFDPEETLGDICTPNITEDENVVRVDFGNTTKH